MKLFHRRVLLGLIASACALAFPAIASASAGINPQLTISPGGPAGQTGQTVAYDLSFTASPAGSDSPATIINHFPAGMLADSTINNDQCLAATNLTAACQIASGTVTVLTPTATPLPAAEYLVPAPNPAKDVAGVQLEVFNGVTLAPSGPPADVTVRPNDAGLDVTFSNIPGPTVSGSDPPIKEIQLSLTDQRLPSSCAAETMTVNTVSEGGANEQSNKAPYQSTGCPAQPYNPKVAANVTALGNGGANVSATISQAADEAASQSIELDLPSSLQPNLLVDAGCLSGTSCQIGTASALTPLAPPQALANGTVTLGGSISAPMITVAFPAPYQLSFTGAVNISNNSVLVSGIPDVPITSLSLNITHSQFGPAFTTTCQPATIVGKFTGQGGQSATVNAPVNYSGCTTTPPPPGKPTSTASVGGLASGHPVLHLHIKHGSNAPDISSVAITVGSGLKFSKKALKKHCTGHGHHKKCTTKAKGLSVTGGTVKSVVVHGSGRIVITFTHPVSAASITIRGPLLTESKGLQKRAKKHKVKKVSVVLKITDAKGTRTTITLHPKA